MRSNPSTPMQIEELIENAKHLAELESSVANWKIQMEACAAVRKRYSDSPFAQDVFKKQEKQFKRLYWEAHNIYLKFKNEVISS